MKIVHVAPSAPYNDYWGYQENLLPKYQRKLGHDVVVITTNTKHKNNQIIEIEPTKYILSDGVQVIRCKRKKYPIELLTRLSDRMNIYDILVNIKPDYIFFHGLVSRTIFDVIKYKRHYSNCIIVEDNHLDYNIGRGLNTLNDKIICMYYRFINKASIKYVEKVYGVTPWRKKYAEEYFGIPSSKTDVLIMGADDEKIDLQKKDKIRKKIRNKYGIKEQDFLIVTGGKIDKKKKIDLLMEACARNGKVKLLIFGNIADNIKKEFDSLIKKNVNLIYVGWINSDDVYKFFFAADLVFFPGQHSVLWEQACASKVPCVFEKWEGMEHVNNGGNSDFVSKVTVKSLVDKINQLYFTNIYYEMKKVAESDATDIYLYSKIALKSLECVKKCGKD